MFEFSLKNGKQKLKFGIVMLFVSLILMFLLIWGIIAIKAYPDNVQPWIYTIVMGLGFAVCFVLAIPCLIFGAIVYRTERTSLRSSETINKEFDNFKKQEEEKVLKDTEKQLKTTTKPKIGKK